MPNGKTSATPSRSAVSFGCDMSVFANLATFTALATFTVATGYGIVSLRRGTVFIETVTYVTLVAAANAGFRCFTLWHRIHDYPFPQPITTQIALVLQVALAAAILLILAVAHLQTTTTQHVAMEINDGS